MAGRLAQDALAASALLRQAGAEAVLAAGFDEVFVGLDPYSRYVAAAEAAEARRDRVGQAGLGLRIGPGRRGGIAVTQVRPGGPAARAGLLAGDEVLAIDGVPVSAADSALAALLLEGPAGSTAELRLRRDGRTVVARVARERDAPPAVEVQRRGAGVLVLRLPRLVGGTAAQVEAAIAAEGVTGAILDLRGNRGGVLSEALAVADLFLDSRRIASAEGRHQDSSRVWDAAGPDLFGGRPVVVLVDGRTASGAEILAAALADSGRAVIVGSLTRGKGLIQVVIPLPGGAELHLSWSRLRTSRGSVIEGVGIVPALCTSRGEAAAAAQVTALERGEQPMREALAAASSGDRGSVGRVMRALCPPAEGRAWDESVALALLGRRDAYAAALHR